MSEKNPPSSNPATDCVLGFHLARTGIKGRIARLGPAVDAIIRRHDYGQEVGALLAESLALTAVLANALKYDGVFTLQTKGDGPVGMLVADILREGAMRGYAQFDPEKVKLAGVHSALLLGKGHLAFTVDQGSLTQRYQGIVDLIGRDMAACVQTYFRQSEQLEAEFRVHTGKNKDGQWQAAAIMLQRIPQGGGYAANSNIAEGDVTAEQWEEDWRRTTLLMQTTTDTEMLVPKLELAEVLHRLFHEEGLALGDSLYLRDECRCSRPRVAMVLSTLPREELQEMLVDGKVEVKCEFCSQVYHFDAAQIAQLEAGPGVRE
jgi:molecular chaperone Hsp33